MHWKYTLHISSYGGPCGTLQFSPYQIYGTPNDRSYVGEELLLNGTMKVLGHVVDSRGRPLAGVTVKLKNSKRSVRSNSKGEFVFLEVPEDAILIITFVGYESREVKAAPDLGEIRLTAKENKLSEVLIQTGMFMRKKETFTGATATYNGDQIRAIGGTNILQGLKSVDPSFMIIDNNAFGSNPNQLPQIEMRGRSSINTQVQVGGNKVGDQFRNDPNQPLFILDGMETSLRRIVDLDVNRVASITLLKDAASTALYGSKAANGVVVVETIRPKPGEIKIHYTAAGTLEVPDLKSYNMMNAAEHLEFQRLSGMYKPNSTTIGFPSQDLYNKRLKEVQQGVNSYWLNTPLRNVFNVGHSLDISGGDQNILYGIGGNYRDFKGVMIGSNRQTWSGNISLGYRKKNINITNLLTINRSNSNESSYGTFSDYVRLSPYYRKTDEFGNLNRNRYLEQYQLSGQERAIDYAVANPLYNASLNSRNRGTSNDISNNLVFYWDLRPDLRINGGVQYSQIKLKNERYVPALNTAFDNTPVLEKGSLNIGQEDQQNYQAFLALTYNRVFQKRHALTVNVRGSVSENQNTSLTTIMVGFPAGVEPIPAFAGKYAPDTGPGGGKSKFRTQSALVSVNYSYKSKYNVDATYNNDGANSFGSERVFKPFWSIGLSWNIEKENIFKQLSWIDQLRLRANIGTNGNQGFGQFVSTSTYLYEGTPNSFGQSLRLKELGNPQLDWQKTRQTSLGLDAILFHNKLSVTVNAYQKVTDPLIAGISLPTSTGLTTFYDNVGILNSKGLEVILKVTPIHRPDKNFLWTIGVMGSILSAKYDGLSQVMDKFNKKNQESVSLLRYYDGYSPDDIWAVRSLGIDPATGSEIFLTKKGEYSTVYISQDQVKVGNGRPLLEGTINTNLNYKAFSLGINLRYKIGASALNSALYEKVENISADELQYNQDRRVLYKRWQKAGDMASFKSIENTGETSISSRFIQKENLLAGESISLSYTINSGMAPWLAKAGLSGLNISATTNDIFRVSNILMERGTTYPFGRIVTFTINASF